MKKGTTNAKPKVARTAANVGTRKANKANIQPAPRAAKRPQAVRKARTGKSGTNNHNTATSRSRTTVNRATGPSLTRTVRQVPSATDTYNTIVSNGYIPASAPDKFWTDRRIIQLCLFVGATFVLALVDRRLAVGFVIGLIAKWLGQERK